jgi:rare lipoprotein A
VDLSYAGAVMLDYAGKGTARVRVEAIVPGIDTVDPGRVGNIASAAVPEAPAAPAVAYATASIESIATERQRIERGEGSEYLQVGAFANLASAQGLVARLSSVVAAPVSIHSDPGADGRVLHKVRIGPLADTAEEDSLIESVQRAQLGTPFKVRI